MGKVALIVITAVVLVLGVSGIALAEAVNTPQDIYDDYADNGKLDGTYTDEELQAYLNDSLIDQYGDPNTVAELDALVTRMLDSDDDEFPMTGAQMAFIGIGALALVGVGIGLRRVARSRA